MDREREEKKKNSSFGFAFGMWEEMSGIQLLGLIRKRGLGVPGYGERREEEVK